MPDLAPTLTLIAQRTSIVHARVQLNHHGAAQDGFKELSHFFVLSGQVVMVWKTREEGCEGES